ncbi:protein-L-isoaspartate(D-aspartate) O-methyltransferase [Candidatus Saganbacteria bacterium]|nr:protein-L-isoaspartate(D-aspartate) O-methyltransferase [Candidatus Saganbacteria bacterium]
MLSLQADLGELSDDTRLVPLCLITEKVFPEEFGRSELSRYFDGYFRAQSDKLFDNIATKRGDFAGLGNVLDAMRAIKRELFCPREEAIYAYNNSPLPIGSGQTISQPEIVAIMTALLDLHGTERVLEIGTGSGYQAAVLSRLAREVYTIERFPGLAEKAKIVLKQIGADNVAVIVGNGISGSIEKAPFDRILVTAMADHIPEALLGQLKEGGRMVIPVAKQKGGNFGMLNMIDRRGGEILVKEILLCAFVELVNEG